MAMMNGAELTRELGKSGTGERKLNVCREKLAEVKSRENRIATAEEVILALQDSEAVGEVTLAKAYKIAGITQWAVEVAKAHAELPIEEQLLGGTGQSTELDASVTPSSVGAVASETGKPLKGEDGDKPAAESEFTGPKKVGLKTGK